MLNCQIIEWKSSRRTAPQLPHAATNNKPGMLNRHTPADPGVPECSSGRIILLTLRGDHGGPVLTERQYYDSSVTQSALKPFCPVCLREQLNAIHLTQCRPDSHLYHSLLSD